MYIARQPIFRKDLEVYGYELLFRSESESSEFDSVSGEEATASILAGFYEYGASNIIEGKVAFVNFGNSLVDIDLRGLFEPSQVIIDLMDDVEFSPTFVEHLLELRSEGFRISAKADLIDTYPPEVFEKMDILRFDIERMPLDSVAHIVSKCKANYKFVLAEKIETDAEFQEAKDMGFDFFQGFFFAKPHIVGTRNEKLKTTAAMYSRVLQELNKEEPSFQKIAELVRMNVDLNYKLMRMISKRNKNVDPNDVLTVRQALAYMGFREIARWINVLMLSDVGKEKPSELLKVSLLRSFFMEKLIAYTVHRDKRYEASVIGLFSVLDALSDMTMGDALQDILLPDDVKGALLDNQGVLYILLSLVIAYERGEFDTVNRLRRELGVENEDLFDAYYLSVIGAKEIAVDIGLTS